MAPAQAQIVTTFADSGAGSLRQTIADATNDATITFTNTLSGQTIVLTSGQLLAETSLAIDASDLSDGIIIDGNHTSRIFEFAAGTTNALMGLTLTNAWSLGSGFPDGAGGAVFLHYNASLAIDHCTLAGNHADLQGGAIYNEGTLWINGSTLDANSASYGGGIENHFYSSQLRVSNTTLSANSSVYDGGGVYNSGALTLYDATLSGNSAGYGGGGICNNDGGLLKLNNVTLSGNSAHSGGGIGNQAAGTLLISNSIVAGNWAANADPNIFGSFIGSNNLTNDVPLLAPLGNYGGPTETMPPLPGSPAIDAGGPTTLTTDQRGYPRVVGTAVDIGAVEFQGASEATMYTDTAADLFAGVSGDGILDITSAAVWHTVSNITFRIVLAGDPTATDWGKYMVAIHSEPGGDTTGNPWLRPIGMDVGMNYWLGAWVNCGNGLQASHYSTGAWSVVGGSVPNGGNPQVPELTVTKDTQSVTITSPLGLLGLSLGQTIQFDIYTSGSGTDGAIDALANPAQTVTDWSQYYNSGTNLYSYTLTFFVPPALTINFNPQLSTLTVSWPSPSTGWDLEQNTDLNTPNWATPPEPVTDNGTEKFITVTPSAGNRFYRLHRP